MGKKIIVYKVLMGKHEGRIPETDLETDEG